MASVINFLPIQSGTGDPSPENVRPITAPVHIVGKNLFNVNATLQNPDNTSVTNTSKRIFTPGTYCPGCSYSNYFSPARVASYSVTNGVISVDCSSGYGLGFAVSVTAGESYFISGITTNKGSMNVCFYDVEGNALAPLIATNYFNKSVTAPEDAVILVMIFRCGTSGTASTFSNVQLEVGTSATEYEPYTETPIYGGYLDIGNNEVVEEWTHISDTWGNFNYGADLDTCTRKYLDLTQTGDRKKGIALTDISGTYLINNSSDTIHYYLNERGKAMYCIMPTNIDENTVVSFAYPLATPITHALNSAQLAHIMAELNVRYSSMLESRRRILMNSPHVEKQTTETAFFKTDLKAPLKECKISFTPVQEGTGDPSPTNIRPINCWTKVNVGQTRKNIVEVVGYSTENGSSITTVRKVSNNYGTTISTVDFIAPHGEVTITQTVWPVSETPYSYRNGYFTIFVNNLVFGKYYTISCRIINITNNPLDIDIGSKNNFSLQSPSGGVGSRVIKSVDGDKIIWRHVQWLPYSNNHARSNFEIRNCGISFTMSDFMVTAEDEENQTYEPYTDTDIIPITFPFVNKNHANIVGYSAQSINTPTDIKLLSNSYGTAISAVYPSSTLTITQDNWPNTDQVYNYHNGYFNIITDNLEFGKKYILSFKIDEISNNPLNVSPTQIRIGPPFGSMIRASTQTGNRLIFGPLLYSKYSSIPTRTDISVYNCGMSLTISDIMITEADEEDQSYVPFESNFYGGYIDLKKGEIVAEWAFFKKKLSEAYNKVTYDNCIYYDFHIKDADTKIINNNKQLCNIAPYSWRTQEGPVPHFYAYSLASDYYYDTRLMVYMPLDVDESIEVQIVAPLQTPIHYQIDPITFKTLKGINTIWNDANGDMNLSYWTH